MGVEQPIKVASKNGDAALSGSDILHGRHHRPLQPQRSAPALLPVSSRGDGGDDTGSVGTVEPHGMDVTLGWDGSAPSGHTSQPPLPTWWVSSAATATPVCTPATNTASAPLLRRTWSAIEVPAVQEGTQQTTKQRQAQHSKRTRKGSKKKKTAMQTRAHAMQLARLQRARRAERRVLEQLDGNVS